MICAFGRHAHAGKKIRCNLWLQRIFCLTVGDGFGERLAAVVIRQRLCRRIGIANVNQDGHFFIFRKFQEFFCLVRIKEVQPASVNPVARIESFKTTPKLDTLMKLMRPLGLTLQVAPIT